REAHSHPRDGSRDRRKAIQADPASGLTTHRRAARGGAAGRGPGRSGASLRGASRSLRRARGGHRGVLGSAGARREGGRRGGRTKESRELSAWSRNREARLELHIDASPATVFALLTDPAQMSIWLAEIVEADARAGGAFRISGPPGVAIEGKY